MILDNNKQQIKIGDKVKNIDTGKTFTFTKEMEIVLNHSELFPQNNNKTWQYNHLTNLT